MRPIDADALSERMYHDAFETDSDMQKWDSGCWIRYKMFENAIAEAPTIEPERRTGKWIPCSERMPEESVEVLTYTEILCLIEIQTLERDGNGVWRWEDSQGGWQYTSTVTAWMPLPEPYHEEES